MKLEIFDKTTRQRIGLIKTYNFIQFIDKFNDIGTFEIKVPSTESSISYLQKGNYILFDDGMMGVIKYRYKSQESTTMFSIKGFTLKKILWNRSFLQTAEYNGTITNIARQMVTDLLISPTDLKREVSFLSLAMDEEYIPVSSETTIQVTGDRLSDKIQGMLGTINYGYDIFPVLQNYDESQGRLANISNMEFRVLKPADRSIGNLESNPPVVFSMDMNNLANFVYEEDDSLFCSTAVVAGEGEGMGRTIVETGDTSCTGIDRIELYVDARDLQRDQLNGTILTNQQYDDLLIQRGKENLKDYKEIVVFYGTVVNSGMSRRYKTDFFNGDYVSIIDTQLGITIKVQITEVITSVDDTGEIIDLTFGYDKATIQELIRKKGVI